MILQNSSTIPGQKALFQIRGVFQDQGKKFSRSVQTLQEHVSYYMPY